MELFNGTEIKEVDINLIQQEMYQQIFNKLQDYLPEGWQKIDFHTVHTKRKYSMKYFVMTENKWVDCFNLIDRKELVRLFIDINKDITNVWNRLPEKHKWYVLNMVVDRQGHINVTYDYADDVKDNDDTLLTYLTQKEREWSKSFKN